MIAYVSAPYSKIDDKHALMRLIAKQSGMWMLANPGWFAITGLVHHYAAQECSELGTDYVFWETWCEEFLQQCDKLLVLEIDGWDNSVGVQAEIALAHRLMIPVEYLKV